MLFQHGSVFGCCRFFFFQAEDGIRDLVRSRGLGDVYKRQRLTLSEPRVEQDDKPLSLDPPINVAINSFTLQGGVVRRAGEQLAQILSLIHI